MKKVLIACLLIGALFIFTGNVYAQEQQDLSREKKLFQSYAGIGSTSVSSFCMEGYVFVLVTGNLSNSTILVQVYEEKNGKVVPKRCE